MDDSTDVISLESGGCRIEFDLASGLFSLRHMDRPVFVDAHCAVLVSGEEEPRFLSGEGSWLVRDSGESGFLLERRADWGKLLFKCACADGALVLEAGFVWEKEEPPAVEAVAPLLVPHGDIWPENKGKAQLRFFLNGFQCWTPSGVLKFSRRGDYLLPLFFPGRLKPMLLNPTTPVPTARGSFTGEWFAAVADVENAVSLVVGFTGVKRALSQVSVRLDRKGARSELKAAAMFEGQRAGRGTEFWGEPLAVIPGDLTPGNLERYAEMLADGQGVGEVRRSEAGWCTWYQYFSGVTRADVEKNLGLLSSELSDLGVELVQIDDGYAPFVGDWLETADTFPGDMGSLAREIESKGRTPGIWVAPFTVTARSRVMREHPDWVIRRPKRRKKPVTAGFNPEWKGRFFGLDLTNPEVLEHIRRVFTTLKGQGYRFFKLDFMATAFLEGDRHDSVPTRAEAARRALEVIRDAVGEDSYLLAAGGPVLLGVGILDAQRVGGDVAPYWTAKYQNVIRDRATPGVRNSIMNALARAFMSGRLFDGDPDCLMLRSESTRLTEAERRTHASLISCFGGALIISDDLSLWGDAEKETAHRLIPHVASKPRCPDLWRREVPCYLLSALEDPSGPYHLALVINWGGRREASSLKLEDLGLGGGAFHASEFWTGRYLGVSDTTFRLPPLESRDCAVLKLTPAGDRPALVGSSVHITQGAAELKRFEVTDGRVEVAVAQPAACGASLTLSLPGAKAAKSEAGELRQVADGVFRLGYRVEDPAVSDIVIEFDL